jgi:hypothetical protein
MSTVLAVGLVPLMDTKAHTPTDRDQTSSKRAEIARHFDRLGCELAPSEPLDVVVLEPLAAQEGTTHRAVGGRIGIEAGLGRGVRIVR